MLNLLIGAIVLLFGFSAGFIVGAAWYATYGHEVEEIGRLRAAFTKILGWRENDFPEGSPARHVIDYMESVAREALAPRGGRQ